MDKLNEDLVNYNLIRFLSLQEKKNLSSVNRDFYYFHRKTVYHHIGTIIASNLGFNRNNYQDIEILRDDSIGIIKDIIDFLFEFNYKKNKFNCKKYFTKQSLPVGILYKINNLDRESCIKKIKENELRFNKKKVEYSYWTSKVMKNKFRNAYSILVI